jgi:hypothetical protein
MNAKIFDYIKKYCENKGYDLIDEVTVIQVIREADHIWKSKGDRHRWWVCYTYAIEIDGMFIGYDDAEKTGDMNAEEARYQFDLDSIKEYQAREIKTIVYEPVKLY